MNLPPRDQPGKLLRVALDDMAAAKRMTGVTIDMGSWCRKTGSGYCAVCLAGVILLAKNPKAIAEFMDGGCQTIHGNRAISQSDVDKLLAIDKFRRGHVELAFKILELEKPPIEQWYDPPYSAYPEQWWKSMTLLAREMELWQVKVLPAETNDPFLGDEGREQWLGLEN